MEKSIKINVPEGYEIDKEKSTFENIVFKPIETKLPKTWEELGLIDGYYLMSNSDLKNIARVAAKSLNKNIFATKEQAEASIALAQLSQLREVYRTGWKPDWKLYQAKYIIRFISGTIDICQLNNTEHFLSFQSAEVRDLFLENFRDLIEKAKPLMS